MNKKTALEIINNAFCHLIIDEDIKVGPVKVLMHFPSIGIALLESSEGKIDDENVEDYRELLIKKELEAKVVYLDLDAKNFNIGYVINDILLEAGFIPAIELDVEDGAY